MSVGRVGGLNGIISSVILSMIILAASMAVSSPPFRSMVEASVDGRLAASGTFEPAALSRFVDYPPSGAVANSAMMYLNSPFKPNPKFWAKDVDFSCASPWNSAGGSVRAGTAISPRHIVFAKHFPLWKDVRVVFVGNDGSPCACYVDKVKALRKGDIMIASLDAELPPTVTPAKILPANYTNFIGQVEGLPAVAMTQEEKATVWDLTPLSTNSVYDLFNFLRTENPPRSQYRVKIRSGDSGSPVFLIAGREPILLYCLTTSQGGYAMHLFRNEIQTVMDELCPGYKLEEFDFAAVGR